MAFVNYNNKEITTKIVYYGPALSGKTTCLRYIFNCEEIENKGKLITLDTDGDRTLFFDFLPLEIGKLGSYSIKIQLYTVPGQVAYDTTRKLVLQGADGVVFVADSQMVMREQNIESFANLKKNLKLNNLQFEKIPMVFHFNKRDLKEILPVNSLNKDLNPDNKSFFPTVATSGENVLEGLYAIIKLVIIYLKNQLSIFQKDKTIMFSREEITSSTPKTKDNKVLESEPGAEKGPGDTDKEEIFELSSPMVDAEDSFKPAANDDIFDLDDAQEIKNDEADSEILEMNFENEEYKDTDAVNVSGMMTDDENTGDRSLNAQGKIKSIDVPIALDISKDPDNVQISINLRLTIKKK